MYLQQNFFLIVLHLRYLYNFHSVIYFILFYFLFYFILFLIFFIFFELYFKLLSGGNDSVVIYYNAFAGTGLHYKHHKKKVLSLGVNPVYPDTFVYFLIFFYLFLSVITFSFLI
jgi:hypothetical protein